MSWEEVVRNNFGRKEIGVKTHPSKKRKRKPKWNFEIKGELKRNKRLTGNREPRKKNETLSMVAKE